MFSPTFLALIVLLSICTLVPIPSTNAKVPPLTITRIASELKEISRQGISIDVPFNTTNDECGVRLSPLRKNLLEWHFSFTGVEGSPYEGGVYHGRIRLHPEYPRRAPTICVMTPTGRWEIGKDICLSASAHHPETWNPNWNLRTLVMSLRGFMATEPREIGSISNDGQTRRALAKSSKDFFCYSCGVRHEFIGGGGLGEIINDPIKSANYKRNLKIQKSFSATEYQKRKKLGTASNLNPDLGGKNKVITKNRTKKKLNYPRIVARLVLVLVALLNLFRGVGLIDFPS